MILLFKMVSKHLHEVLFSVPKYNKAMMYQREIIHYNESHTSGKYYSEDYMNWVSFIQAWVTVLLAMNLKSPYKQCLLNEVS